MVEEIEEVKCQVCRKPKEECNNWNPYYQACEDCL